jgi:hypothetical protein
VNRTGLWATSVQKNPLNKQFSGCKNKDFFKSIDHFKQKCQNISLLFIFAQPEAKVYTMLPVICTEKK